MKKIFYAVITLLIASCAEKGEKKILIISNKDATIDQSAKTITIKAPEGYSSETIEYNTGDAISLQVKSSEGEKSVNIPDNGFYVLNAKMNDTIVGSYQRYVKSEEASRKLTQEDLMRKIDSLKLLIENKNVTAANRNFFILPNTAVKISDNSSAQVVAPYHQLNYIEPTEGKEPEVYRFYTVKEVRETIEKLEGLTK